METFRKPSEKTLEGNIFYWPISSRNKKDYLYDNNKVRASNKIIVPLEKLFMPNDIIDVKYVYKDQYLYFLRKGYSQTIFYQYMQNVSQGINKNSISTAEFRFKENDYNQFEISDFNIIKIFSTRNSLFAFVKRDNKYYIVKVINERYKYQFVFNEIIFDDKFTNNNDIEINIYDFPNSEYISLIFINNTNTKELFVGKFKSSRNKILLNKIIIKTIADFKICSFCINNNKETPTLSAFDNSQGMLIEFNIKADSIINQKTIEIEEINYSAIISDNNINNINTYRISPQYLSDETPVPNAKMIELILLNSRNNVYMFDILTKKFNKVFGNIGNIDFDEDSLHQDLYLYNSHEICYLYPIENNGIIFQRRKVTEDRISEIITTDNKFFMLLSYKFREVMFDKGKKIEKNEKQNYRDS